MTSEPMPADKRALMLSVTASEPFKSQLKECAARIAELEAQLAAAQQGVQPVAWLAEYVDREGNSAWYVSTHKELAVENDRHGTPRPLYTHPTTQGLDAQRLKHLIRTKARVVSDETCGDGYWLEYQRDDGTTWVQLAEFATPEEAIDASIAAQAKQTEALQTARNGGCGCCSNACDDRADGCRFVHENLSDADMVAAQEKQGV